MRNYARFAQPAPHPRTDSGGGVPYGLGIEFTSAEHSASSKKLARRNGLSLRPDTATIFSVLTP